MSNKVYVDVLAEFSKDGLLIPKEITWEDGRKYEITRVRDKRRAASTRAGHKLFLKGAYFLSTLQYDKWSDGTYKYAEEAFNSSVTYHVGADLQNFRKNTKKNSI